jgi:hypothetical protein
MHKYRNHDATPTGLKKGYLFFYLTIVQLL